MAKGKLTSKQQEALAKGRRIGAPLGGKKVMNSPAPSDCTHCRMFGYTKWSQHLGHLSFAKLLQDQPTALHHVRNIIISRRSR